MSLTEAESLFGLNILPLCAKLADILEGVYIKTSAKGQHITLRLDLGLVAEIILPAELLGTKNSKDWSDIIIDRLLFDLRDWGSVPGDERVPLSEEAIKRYRLCLQQAQTSCH